MSASAKFLQLINSPIKFRFFLLSKLPSAFFCGVRVRFASEEKAIVTVPYKWLSQNPFRSTYFACLSMAAEMSTGVLAMAHVYKRQPAISMLVQKIEADFVKKAVGTTWFECEAGAAIKAVIQEAIDSGEARSITVASIGKNKDGEKIANFYITWSFKAKSV